MEELTRTTSAVQTANCANCFIPVAPSNQGAVTKDGQLYCCQGCAQGGPCNCSYCS